MLTDRNTELTLLGAMISDRRTHNLVSELSESDFAEPETREIYRVIVRMVAAKEPINLAIMDAETGGALTNTLLEAIQLAPTAVFAPYHAQAIKEASVRRQVSDLASGLYRDMGDHTVDLSACLEHTKKRLSELNAGKRQDWVEAPELADATFAWLESLSRGEVKPVQSGIVDLDRLIGGFFPGELTIIGAKPGTGKTVMGMLVAINAAKSGFKVGVLNIEMLNTQYGTRIISNLGQVDATKLRMGRFDAEDWESILRATRELSKLSASFLFSTRHIEDLVSAIHDKALDLLVVDYMQLVRTKQAFESERLRMGHISWALKELAVDKRIPIIAMSQLRRPDAGSSDKMPTMRDLRESGNLEADADGIILLHEPSSERDPYVYRDDKGSLEAWQKKGLRYICVKVEKQRQGAVGTVPVLFDARHMRYLGIERKGGPA